MTSYLIRLKDEVLGTTHDVQMSGDDPEHAMTRASDLFSLPAIAWKEITPPISVLGDTGRIIG